MRNKLLILTCLLPWAALAAEREFGVRLEGESIAYELVVNGESVLIQDKPSQFSVQDVPVNKYLKVGELNVLEVRVRKATRDSKLKVTVHQAGDKEPFGERDVPPKPGESFALHFKIPAGAPLAKQVSIFDKAPAKASDIRIYTTLSEHKPGLKGRVLLNGVEVEKLSGRGGQMSGGTVSEWLMPGENVVEVIATEAPAASEPTPWYQLSLHGMADEGFASDENKLLAVQWPSNAAEATAKHKTVRFTVPTVPPSEVWTKASVIGELSADDKKQIAQVLQQLVEALKTGKVDPALNLWKFRFDDLSRLYRDPKAGEMYRTMIRRALEQGPMTLSPIAWDTLLFSRVAGNRVVRVANGKGEQLIQGTLGGPHPHPLTFEVYLSKIDGVWTLVR